MNRVARQIQFVLETIDKLMQPLLDDIGNLRVIEFRTQLAQSPLGLIAERARIRAGDGVQRFFRPAQTEPQRRGNSASRIKNSATSKGAIRPCRLRYISKALADFSNADH